MPKWINPKSRADWKFYVTWVYDDGIVTECYFPEGSGVCFEQAKEIATDLQKRIKRGHVRVFKMPDGVVEVKKLKALRAKRRC